MAAALLCACAAPTSSLAVPAERALAATPISLATNDVVEIRVFQEADLSGIYRVSPSGEIDVPLCGRMRVAGLTSAEVADAVTRCLAAGFVRHPQVTVTIKEFNSRKVFVFGEVVKPGPFGFDEGMTIVHAISQAGGFTRTASKNKVTVTRVVDGGEVKLLVHVDDIVLGRARNFDLKPGDIIFVPESFF